MAVRNVLLALLLSSIVTFVFAVVYIFYPLFVVIIGQREGAGIGAAGGGSNILLIIIEPVLFISIFAFLQRKSKKKLS